MSPKFLLYLVLVNMPTWHCEDLLAQDTPRSGLTRRPSKKLGVLKLVSKGTMFFEKKKYSEAISVFAVILRSYPSHEPSLVYTARSFYRLGKIDKAYKVFSQLVLENLDPDTSYEYGQAHIRKKKFPIALAAFRRVPSGHPLYDLASYYGGVCAVKTKNYKLGLDLMQQAVVLPSKLMKSRRLYQRYAEGKILEAQKPSKESTEQKQSKPQEVQVVEQPKPEEVIIPNTGFLLAHNQMGTIVSYLSQNQDFSELAQNTAVHSEFGLFANFGNNFEFGEKKIRNHFHLMTHIKATSLEHKNNPISFLANTENDFKYLVLDTDDYNSYVETKLTTGPEWNIGGTTWLALGFSDYILFPEGDLSNSSSRPNIFLNLGQTNANYSLILKIEYMIENVLQEKYRVRTNEYITLAYKLSERLDFYIKGDFSQFDYDDKELDGPDWYNRLSLGVTYSFTPNLSLDIMGQFEHVLGNHLYSIGDGNLNAEFSHTNLGGLASLHFAITKWLSITVNAAGQDRNVDIEPDAPATKSVAEVFPTFLTNFNSQIVAQLSF